MIKKLLFLFLTVSGISSSLNAQNLIVNGNFEAGTGDVFTNWTKTNGAANLTAETVNIHGGLRALKAISTGANEYNVQLQSDAMTTVIGTSYEVSMWIKGVAGGNTVRLSTSGGTAVYGSAFTVTTGWKTCILTFTATATSTKINLDLGKGTDTFYVDDVAMYDLSTSSSSDFILNGNLEAGTGDTFTNWSKYNGAANLTAEAVEIHGGVRGLKAISTGAAEYNVQLVSDVMTLVVGRTYTASMWIKAVTGGNTVRFSTTTTPSSDANYGSNTTIGTTWQKISYSFAAKNASTRLNLDLGKSTDTFYIDDISFIGASITLANEKFESNNNKVVFYPNPVQNDLNISSDAAIKSLIISDSTGKTVKTIKNAENIQSVDVSNLSHGLYILSTDNNQTFKFIKN
ncbi:carbohydrate binding domain-containing protein [Flavobacterium sp. CF136]|uniref:carbohydrate binding domain-containing protein n=1 Tax=Flavobacterium sp. (strain CF136) TaxID=1144313 RepID=UPI00027173D4|nr:carbohydrate binding domain-containing protein [Flavobacterium sp. CF136]EJL65022.1 Por secretion system C-terminal sorting domain-containing protein [Flavobacterium sp. CF136]